VEVATWPKLDAQVAAAVLARARAHVRVQHVLVAVAEGLAPLRLVPDVALDVADALHALADAPVAVVLAVEAAPHARAAVPDVQADVLLALVRALVRALVHVLDARADVQVAVQPVAAPVLARAVAVVDVAALAAGAAQAAVAVVVVVLDAAEVAVLKWEMQCVEGEWGVAT